jgi:NDP-sugar pyrophosphorylase family protein
LTEISTAIILAGGLATRLGELTSTIPKSMLRVAGEPFIVHQLRLLVRRGIAKVIICVAHLGEQIQNYIKDGSQLGLRVEYSFDGPTLLGTGGAIIKALSLAEGPCIIVYGDTYPDISFHNVVDAFLVNKKPALMTVFKNEDCWDRSNVIFSNNIVKKYSKTDRVSQMKFIDYGVSVVSKDVFFNYSDNKFVDLASIFETLASEDKLAGYEIHHRFYEIGTLEGLRQTEEYLLKKLEQSHL